MHKRKKNEKRKQKLAATEEIRLGDSKRIRHKQEKIFKNVQDCMRNKMI
jgi:hypothetical protein